MRQGGDPPGGASEEVHLESSSGGDDPLTLHLQECLGKTAGWRQGEGTAQWLRPSRAKVLVVMAHTGIQMCRRWVDTATD